MKQPDTPWEFPAITTFGFKNHAVRTADWRYIRYENGDEELYHSDVDPWEYTNLASNPEFAVQKSELARWLPKTDTPDLPSARNAGNE